ncbi:electron transfer flavoprotein subunit alpha/FixB family protein [bacterium]|nr:electron transfer flavoprotein subunit alpha/FixB family protein [candidate division CSSED10-310 bacterium]
MSGILVWVETKNGRLRKSSLEAIQAGLQIGKNSEPVSAVVIGDRVLADHVAIYPLKNVFVISGDQTKTYQSEPFTDAFFQAFEVSGASTVIMGATALGRDLSARLAARMDAVLATDIISVDMSDGLSILKPVYSGKLIAKISLDAPRQVITIRPNVFDTPEETGNTAPVVVIEPVSSDIRAQVREAVTAAQDAIDITEAEIIVSGGRGVGGPDGFKLLEETAKLLGGSVGASRTAVDEGWIPYKHQVGQTGKVVSPILYIACGISGAIQHFAGMGSARFIIAINTDPEAPIMKKADFAIVGNLFNVLPALRDELGKIIRK